MSNKAVQIKTITPETKQLQIFINNLGVTNKAKLYKFKQHVYINAAIIAPVLNINLQTFVSRAKQPKHYIVIRKEVYVNKYGLTKLIANSDEEASYRLQDYIYEVIYKLETQGEVKINNIASRKELERVAADLSIFQAIDQKNQLIISQYEDEIKQIQTDNSILEFDIDKYKKENERLTDEIKQLQDENETLTSISKSLAKYVRSNTRSRPVALSEVDIDNETALSNDDIIRKAQQAKKMLLSSSSTTSSTSSTSITTSTEQKYLTSQTRRGRPPKQPLPEATQNNIYYLMRTPEPVCQHNNSTNIYRWSLRNKLPEESIMIKKISYKSYKAYCADYKLGGMNNFIYTELWHCDIELPDETYILFSRIVDLLQHGSIELFDRLVDIFSYHG